MSEAEKIDEAIHGSRMTFTPVLIMVLCFAFGKTIVVSVFFALFSVVLTWLSWRKHLPAASYESSIGNICYFLVSLLNIVSFTVLQLCIASDTNFNLPSAEFAKSALILSFISFSLSFVAFYWFFDCLSE